MVRTKQAGPKSTPLKLKEKARKELRKLGKKSKDATANESLSDIKHHFQAKKRALQEMRYYQKARLSFDRVVREITLSVVPPEYLPIRYRPLAIEALQEAAEMYLAQFLEDCVSCYLHAKRVTLKDVDVQSTRRISG